MLICLKSSDIKSRYENPQKLSQLSADLIGDISWLKGQHKKDIIVDIISDSQVNSNLPYRWSPAVLTLNILLNLLVYLYITRITIKNDTPHLKSQKNKHRRVSLERRAITGEEGVGGVLRLIFG